MDSDIYSVGNTVSVPKVEVSCIEEPGMPGKTLVQINQATLVEAMQEYFDRRVPGNRVAAVCVPGSGYFSDTSGNKLSAVVVEINGKEPST